MASLQFTCCHVRCRTRTHTGGWPAVTSANEEMALAASFPSARSLRKSHTVAAFAYASSRLAELVYSRLWIWSVRVRVATAPTQHEER